MYPVLGQTNSKKEKVSSSLPLSGMTSKEIYQHYLVCWLDRYPELSYLLDERVQISQEGVSSDQQGWSVLVCGKKYPEFDRTVLGLIIFELLLEGGQAAYEKLVSVQKSNVLSFGNFCWLHQRVLQMVDNDEMQKLAFQVAIVLGDIGKSDLARQRSEELELGIHSKCPDHDDFHGALMELEENKIISLCPSYEQLSVKMKSLLKQASGLFHFAHICHLEGGTLMFDALERSQISRDILDFAVLVDLVDIASARGHIEMLGSLVLTETTCNEIKVVWETLDGFLKYRDKQAAYIDYLSLRSKELFDSLDVSKPECIALVRLCAMLRLHTVEHAQLVRRAIEKFKAENKENWASFCRYYGNVDAPCCYLGATPTYVPTVFLNLVNNASLGVDLSVCYEKSVSIGVTMVVNGLRQFEVQPRHREHPINFNEVAGVAKLQPCLLELSYYRHPQSIVIKDTGEVQVNVAGGQNLSASSASHWRQPEDAQQQAGSKVDEFVSIAGKNLGT